MQVIIPLAGLGTRLRPQTHTRPKPLVNVAGKPVLGHILDGLKGMNIEEIIFITGYLGEQIQEYVSANYPVKARYVEQKVLRGQADALQLAAPFIHSPVLIIFADTIFEADLSALESTDKDALIFVHPVGDPSRFGVVVTENGLITRLVEKPKLPVSNLAVIGVYYAKNWRLLLQCIDELIEKNIQTGNEYYLADALQLMVDRGARLGAVEAPVWMDCGKPETLLETNRYLLEHGRSTEPDHNIVNSILKPPVYISQKANVIDSIVGPNVTVAEGATIRHSIVSDSIINEDATIEDATLQESIIGSHARVVGAQSRMNVGDTSYVSLS